MIWNRLSPSLDFDRMFKRSFNTREGRVTKLKPTKTTYREHAKRKMQDSLDTSPVGSTLTSPIVTLVVGREQRLFAAHEEVLRHSPYFVAALKGEFLDAGAKKVDLLDEYVPCFKYPDYDSPATENPKYFPASSSICTRVITTHVCCTTNVEILGISRMPRT